MSEKINDKQMEFLKNLTYLSGSEIKDLVRGWTSAEVLLDPAHLEQFIELGLEK